MSADELRRVADDQVRTAKAALAGRLRRLSDAALQAASDLTTTEPGERVDLAPVHGRHQSVREAAGVLAATRKGATLMRDEADVRLRSGGQGTGRA